MNKTAAITLVGALTVLVGCANEGTADSASSPTPTADTTTRSTSARRPALSLPSFDTDGDHDTDSNRVDAVPLSEFEVTTPRNKPRIVDAQTEAKQYAVCKAGPDKTVHQLGVRKIRPFGIEGVSVPDVVVDGDVVEGFEIPNTVIPAQEINLGCVVEYDAPAGCLGAVEISPLTVPGVTIPGVSLPAVDGHGFHADAASSKAVRIPSMHVAGEKTRQVCQQKTRQADGGRYISSVWRDSLWRDATTRPSGWRDAVTRREACRELTCVPDVYVDSLYYDSLYVDSVFVNSRYLDGRWLEGTPTTVFDERERTSYQTPADVLFDTDHWVLRPDAVAALQGIADKLQATGDAPITVEGHTDARASDVHNQVLSERRAGSVRDWLVQAGIDSARITTRGYGESVPVAPNDTPENLQKNRRVVISVATDS